MGEFFEYPVRTPPIDGTEILLLLHAGITKQVTTQQFIDAAVVTGPPGPTGPQGYSGAGAFPFVFSSTTADADPGPGNLRLNNGTQTAASFMYVDDLATGGIDISGLLATLDDSNSSTKALVELINIDGSKYRAFSISAAVVDGGTYSKLPISHLGGTGTFVDAEVVAIRVSRVGDKGDIGLTGSTGPTGPTGPTGLTGASGGGAQPYTFSNNTADNDPGNGLFRLNNATASSATFLYIDDLTNQSVDVSAFWATVDDSTNLIKGFIEIANLDHTKSRVYSVGAAIVDGGTYTKIPLVHIGGTGSFTNGESLFVSFVRSGDAGFSPVRLTAAAYAALSPPDSNTWYVIVG